MPVNEDKIKAFFKTYSEAEDKLDYKMAKDLPPVDSASIVESGSYCLDDVLSYGGWPKGRLIQLYGPPSSGKTLMTLLAIVNAQKEDPDALQMFIDAEQTFSPSWAKTLGADIERIIVVDKDMAVNGRRCFEMLLGEPKEDSKHIYVGKKKEGILDKIAKKEININLIVLDSLGAIIPPGEDVASVGKSGMSLLARFLSTTFKKLSLEVNKANVPFMVINHKRDNMDPYASSDHTFSGGNTYAHFLSVNVYFEAIGRKDAQILDENENKIGHTIRATVEKTKAGPCPRKCEFKVNFSTGVIDSHEEIAQLAIDYNIVQKTSTVSHEYNGSKWVGFNKFCEAVKENKAFQDELKSKILEARVLKRANLLKPIEKPAPSEEDVLDNEILKKAKKVK